MTAALKKIALRLLVFAINKILANYEKKSAEKDGKPSQTFIQDVQMNRETAAKFKKFIEAHTVSAENEKSAAEGEKICA